jgi:hypothetical protein
MGPGEEIRTLIQLDGTTKYTKYTKRRQMGREGL